jgi:hypothetical protein
MVVINIPLYFAKGYKTIVSAGNHKCGQLSCGHISGGAFVPANIFQNIKCGVSLESSRSLVYNSRNIIRFIYETYQGIIENV